MRGLEAATSRGKMPQQLLKRKGYKIIATPKGYLLVYRKPLAKKQKKQRRLAKAEGVQIEPIKPKIIYGLHRQIHFKPKWVLAPIVEKVFNKNYGKIFEKKIN